MQHHVRIFSSLPFKVKNLCRYEAEIVSVKFYVRRKHLTSRYAGGVLLFVTNAGSIQIDQLLYSGFCTLQNISCSDRQRALSQLQKQMNWNISSILIRSSWVSWSNSNPCPERSSSSSSVSLQAASSSSPSSSPSSASTAAEGPIDQEVRKFYRAFVFCTYFVVEWYNVDKHALITMDDLTNVKGSVDLDFIMKMYK